MKNKFTLTKESCILEKWEGTSHKPISPLGIVFRISPKDEIVNPIIVLDVYHDLAFSKPS